LESCLTLDELFLTFEKSVERQERLIKTVAAALGATPSESSGGEDVASNINLDQGPMTAEDAKKDQKMSYGGGDIKAGKSTIFGYKSVDSID